MPTRCADIVATWPFENVLVDVELTGKQVAGLTYQQAGARITAELDDGRPLDPEATYHVLVNNFIYAGGDDTGIQWREPVIEWIIAQETSPERPLETLLDDTEQGPGR